MDFKKLLFALIICQLAGLLGSFFNSFSIDTWYPTLIKPNITPPGWVFGVVWTILFIIMGISLYLVLMNKENKQYGMALYVFYFQLILNVFWSFFFFTLQNPLMAFIEILILLIVIFLNIIVFYKVNKVSAYLLIPYFLWVIFATILNYFFIVLNYVVIK